MQYAASDQKCGYQWIGKSNTTHQRTCLSLCYISQSKTKLHKCSNLHILPTMHSVTFFLFISQDQTASEREIWRSGNHKMKYDAETYADIKMDFHKCTDWWKNYWNKCMKSQGYHMEGDMSTFVVSLLL